MGGVVQWKLCYHYWKTILYSVLDLPSHYAVIHIQYIVPYLSLLWENSFRFNTVI